MRGKEKEGERRKRGKGGIMRGRERERREG